MTLRPRLTGPARTARATGRMAPGGRMWSESPIPRQAARRVRQMAAPVVAADVVGWGHSGEEWSLGGTTSVPIQWGSGDEANLPGDLLYMFAVGPWTSIAGAAGWTPFVSGSFGGAHYFGMWRISDGSDGSFEVTADAGVRWSARGWAIRGAGPVTPTASVQTRSGVGPWQMLGSAQPFVLQVLAFWPTAALIAGARYDLYGVANDDPFGNGAGKLGHYLTNMYANYQYPPTENIQMVGAAEAPVSGEWIRTVVELA